jgi:hypothetical protein
VGWMELPGLLVLLVGGERARERPGELVEMLWWGRLVPPLSEKGLVWASCVCGRMRTMSCLVAAR